MFGIIRPCRHSLSGELRAAWWAHLCGMCLALRDEHGQLARLVTNYDGLVVSALLDAQLAQPQRAPPARARCVVCAVPASRSGRAPGWPRWLRCCWPRRRSPIMSRTATACSAGGRRPVAGVGRRVAARWAAQGAATALALDLDVDALMSVTARQAELEAAAATGTSVLAVTAPAEDAAAAVFRHTAVLAGRPHNAEPLAEAGRLFGRVAHLLDAVEDLTADDAAGAWNPLTATGTSLVAARRLCDDAALGVELALRDVEFGDGLLVHRLLGHELRHAVNRGFASTASERPPGWPEPSRVGSSAPPGPPRPPGPRRPTVWPGVLAGCLATVASVCGCGLCCQQNAEAFGEGCGQACERACAGCECRCGCGDACGDCGKACDSCGASCASCGDGCGKACDSCGTSCSGCDCGSSCSGCDCGSGCQC